MRHLTARLGGAAVLVAMAAALVPAVTEVAAAHRQHWLVWAGGVPFYAELVPRLAARSWAAVMLLALGGWASSAAPAHPRRWARALSGAALGGFVALLCVGAALPGWIWLLRLGAGEPSALLPRYALAALAPAIGAVLSGASSALSVPLAPLVGWGAGGAVLWLSWGGLG